MIRVVRHLRAAITLLIIFSVTSILSGCSVAESTLVTATQPDTVAFTPVMPILCRSKLGSYALPRGHLVIEVKQTGTAKAVLTVSDIRRADPFLTFCLDHLSDPFADDEIRIIKASGQSPDTRIGYVANSDSAVTATQDKGYGTQLLQWVVSNTVDQTGYILQTLIRTAFIGISGKPDFQPVGRAGRLTKSGETEEILAHLEYDPFDARRSVEINTRLRQLGFCVVLDGVTFNSRRFNPQQYCEMPQAPDYESAIMRAYSAELGRPPPPIRGIAYRPRANYNVLVFQKDDPGGRRAWRLSGSTRVSLENGSPIVSVGISRSVFASRRMAMQFDQGTLVGMCLVKTSELLGAVQVPYEVAKSVVSLPTEIFEVKIGNFSDNIELVRAETALLTAQRQYLEFLDDNTKPLNRPDEAVDPLTLKSPLGGPLTGNATLATFATEYAKSPLKKICAGAPGIVPEEEP